MSVFTSFSSFPLPCRSVAARPRGGAGPSFLKPLRKMTIIIYYFSAKYRSERTRTTSPFSCESLAYAGSNSSFKLHLQGRHRVWYAEQKDKKESHKSTAKLTIFYLLISFYIWHRPVPWKLSDPRFFVFFQFRRNAIIYRRPLYWVYVIVLIVFFIILKGRGQNSLGGGLSMMRCLRPAN